MRRVAVALLHYPVLDRSGQIVTTAITNIDLHDLARSAHTYGLSDVFVVHPIAAQRELAERIREHWVNGSGGRRIPDRTPAMRGLRIMETLEEAMVHLGGSGPVEQWVTSAKDSRLALAHDQARQRLAREGPPVMLIFGTGWGLAESLCDGANLRLAPIHSQRDDGYNHLSVRAAAAITFDRLLGVP
jgi:hypothetical protein